MKLIVFVRPEFVLYSGQGGDVIVKNKKVHVMLSGEDGFDMPLRDLKFALFCIRMANPFPVKSI